jgi:hypothetical protein
VRDEWRLGGFEGRGELTMRSASALRFSKGCSSLNLDRMVRVVVREEEVERVYS